MPELLTVSRMKASCSVLGPGKRSVIWFHGCSRNCADCIAKEMNSSKNNFRRLSASDLFKWVASNQDIEGITLSGGEPLEQNKTALLDFLRLVKTDSRKLSVIVFTGYFIEELHEWEKLKDYVDVLIDGPYKRELNTGLGLRGSTNQRVHFFSDRYTALQNDFLFGKRESIEIDLNADSSLAINGMPKPGFMNKLHAKLAQAGLKLIPPETLKQE